MAEIATPPVANTPEAFYNGLASPVMPEAPMTGAPEPVAAPAAAPIPPVAPPAASPPAAAGGPDDATLDADLSGWIDPQLLETLRQTAKGDLTTDQVWAVAGLAAANPPAAQEELNRRQRDITSARQMLTNLQQQAQIFRRTGLQQRGLYDRQVLEGRNVLVKENLDRANQIGAQLDAPPSNLLDDPSFGAYMTSSNVKLSEKTREVETRRVLAAAAKHAQVEASKAAQKGASPASFTNEWLASTLRLGGVPDDQINALAPDFPAILGVAKSEAASAARRMQYEEDALKAKVAALQANADAVEKRTAVAMENARTGKMNALLDAYNGNNAAFTPMMQLIAGLQQQAAALREQGIMPELAAHYDSLATVQLARLPGLMAANEALRNAALNGTDAGLVAGVISQKFAAIGPMFQAAYPDLAASPEEAKQWLAENPMSYPAQAFWDQMVDTIALETNVPRLTVAKMIDDSAFSLFGTDVVYKYPSTPTPAGAMGSGEGQLAVPPGQEGGGSGPRPTPPPNQSQERR